MWSNMGSGVAKPDTTRQPDKQPAIDLAFESVYAFRREGGDHYYVIYKKTDKYCVYIFR